jgi:putative transposase
MGKEDKRGNIPMTNPTAIQYGTFYHIYNRGINRENIFREERNYEHFLNLINKHLSPVLDLFAYCLLRNHFHCLIRVKSECEIRAFLQTKGDKSVAFASPSKKLSDFFNAYAKAMNKAYGRTGSLFAHPFGRVPIINDRQFWNVITYIHQNPQKHKFVSDFRDWKWSSYNIILTDKPSQIKREVVLEWFGGGQGYIRKHSVLVDEKDSHLSEIGDDD